MQTAAVYKDLFALNDVAMRMRMHGVLVDRAAVEEHISAQRAKLAEAAILFPQTAPSGDFQLGKAGGHGSLRRLFFEHFKLEPLRYSKETRKPKLDAWTIQQYMRHGGEIAACGKHILAARKAAKLLSTYLEGLPVRPSGRVHSAWNVWGAITGRWSSAQPNLQNVPGFLRNVFCAPPGRSILAADYDKLELRILAIVCNDEPLLRAFREGVDVHTQNATDIFGTLSEDPLEWKKQRNFAKRFVYAVNYGAEASTVWASLVVDYPHLKLRDIAELQKRWFKRHPAIKSWHSSAVEQARLDGLVRCPVGGRYEDFPDDIIEANKVLNFPIQGTGGFLANRAILGWAADVERYKWGNVILQVHDELGGEIKDASLEDAAESLQAHMSAEVEMCGQRWQFPADCKVGRDWLHMEKLHV